MAYDELKKIFPEEIYTLESGEEVKVSPVPFGKLVVFGDALTKVVSKLSAAGINLEKLAAEDLGQIFMMAFEEIIGLMGLVLGKDRAWFETITLTDGLGLMGLIIKQNFNEETKKKLDVLLPRIPSVST